MKCLRFAALALIAGCAHTPDELRALAPKASFDTAHPPGQTARCLGRAAEEWKPFLDVRFSASWREGPSAGSYELVISSLGNHIHAVGDVIPDAQGSAVMLWVSPHFAWQSLPEVMADACEPRNLKVRQ